MSNSDKKYLKVVNYSPKSVKKGDFVPKIGQIYEFFFYAEKLDGKMAKFIILRENEGDKVSYPVRSADLLWKTIKIEENTIS